MLGPQVVVQAEPLEREMLPDDGHPEITPILAAVLARQRIAVMAGPVGGAPCLGEEGFPSFVGQTAAFPVRARRFPAMVEKAHVVVLVLERLDLALDKAIKLLEIVGDRLGNVKVHHDYPSGFILVVRRSDKGKLTTAEMGPRPFATALAEARQERQALAVGSGRANVHHHEAPRALGARARLRSGGDWAEITKPAPFRATTADHAGARGTCFSPVMPLAQADFGFGHANRWDWGLGITGIAQQNCPAPPRHNARLIAQVAER